METGSIKVTAFETTFRGKAKARIRFSKQSTLFVRSFTSFSRVTIQSRLGPKVGPSPPLKRNDSTRSQQDLLNQGRLYYTVKLTRLLEEVNCVARRFPLSMFRCHGAMFLLRKKKKKRNVFLPVAVYVASDGSRKIM